MTTFGELSAPEETLAWFVAHTRPRCEKKLAEYCRHEGFDAILPLYKSMKKYPGKVVFFEKPLFPNYVFLRLLGAQRKKVLQSDYVANLLDVPDQKSFEDQLSDILTAVETDYEICVLPHINPGKRVKITAGPLRGMEGFVEERQGRFLVMLRLDFIGQSAAVKVEAGDLELLT
jgi:transcriptional antiterminator RfaH